MSHTSVWLSVWCNSFIRVTHVYVWLIVRRAYHTENTSRLHHWKKSSTTLNFPTSKNRMYLHSVRANFPQNPAWYGLATSSGLLKIIGLFCKRALYSAKKTYNFKEPTKRNYPMPGPGSGQTRLFWVGWTTKKAATGRWASALSVVWHIGMNWYYFWKHLIRCQWYQPRTMYHLTRNLIWYLSIVFHIYVYIYICKYTYIYIRWYQPRTRYDRFHWTCYTIEIHQIQNFIFLGTILNKREISI